MAPSKRTPTSAEIALVPLKSCLVNLPSPLVSLLVNANTPAQNVIVEIQHRGSSTSTSSHGNNVQPVQKTAHVGWTGMPSKRKLAPVVTRDGINGMRGQPKEQDVAVLEIDSTFGRVLGLSDGQRIGILLHIDPPVAHTVNIEPLTPADWEIIELHANFLELNLLSQIRALPNPTYTPSADQAENAHPLTLHLSPTSTANIIITSLTPQAPSTSPFAKISSDAEVIVAPKVRPKTGRSSQSGNRSTASTGRRSQGARSVSSTQRPRSSHSDSSSRGAVFLRAVGRISAVNYFDEDIEGEKDDGLKIWIDREVIAKNELRGSSWACVSIVRPAALQAPVDPQQELQQKELETPEAGSISRKIIARLLPWDESPDSEHVALSSLLCSALEFNGLVGGIVRIEAAPPPLQKPVVKTLKIFPFGTDSSKKKDGFRFGGDSASSRNAFAERLKMVYGSTGSETGILSGPITDGMLLPKLDDQTRNLGFDGGLIKFDPPLSNGSTPDTKATLSWVLGSESKIAIEMQTAIVKPSDPSAQSTPEDEIIPPEAPKLVGIDPVINNCMSNLTRSSSILLTGGLGSGKTSLTYLLAQQLQEDYLFNVTYFPCRKLLNDETRVSTIKETLQRLFLSAAWCARLGGNSVVILDDLDKLCPVETELQVGGENGRSRQISEIVCSTVREFCSASSPVVLLATAQSKESLNNVIVGGHVVREIISLKAPTKEGRRRVLELLTKEDKTASFQRGMNGHVRNPSSSSQDSWLNPSNPASRPGSSGESDGFVLSRDLDFLDLAGKTDGYMPGDLVLLVGRARNEALIKAVQDTTSSSTAITLGTEDFDRALKGFTPASLRNVTLTTSSITFSAIGGLQSTRNTLLETLQYPTKYAPIFSQCPLRLRSGLLLYGFPGCGKTLLASAVAGECGLNFISVKGPEILNKYIGASEKSVRDLFERAEAARPCILFFDEFDSIAPKRGHDSTGVTDRVVNQLLTQMDGAEGLSGVYVLAATSRPDLIDPALLRPGRLDKSLLCDMPNHADRVDIIQALSGKLKLSDDVMSRLYEIAGRTEGYSGADLQAVVYNAHLEAIHDALGDRTPPPANTGKNSKKSATSNGTKTEEANEQTAAKTSQASKPFIQFLYDSKEHTLATTSSKGVRNASLDPPAVIAAKLEELKKSRQRQRQTERGHQSDSLANTSTNNVTTDAAGLDDDDKDSDEICIEWTHIERSLATTRCSISAVERRRLESIYREFIVGRNGEMPTGEGARDVGGRTTLM